MDTITLIRAIGILAVFILTVALMMTKKLPTIIALPLMAIVFSLIAGVPLTSSDPEKVTLFKTVLQQGGSRMADAMASLMFGAWFAQILNRLGITKGIVKKAAEMGGDKPLTTSLIFFVAAAIIFLAGNGLGMYILVGTIIIPIMITTGVSPFNAGLVTLLSGCVGGLLSVANWPVMVQTLGVTIEQVGNYIWVAAVPLIIACLLIIITSIKSDLGKRRAWAMPTKENDSKKSAPLISYVSPVVPVLLVFLLKMDIIPAIIIAALVAIVLAHPKRPIHVLSSALVEGIQDVAGALALFVGIGMLLMAVTAPEVSGLIQPLIESIIPHTLLGHIFFFVLLAPFAIYRGPMNLFGLGAGISALLISSGMAPLAVLVGMQAVGNVQGACDPTNSYFVWIADFTKTEVTDYLKKNMPFILAAVALSMIIGMPLVLK